jgi:hypothetical protein
MSPMLDLCDRCVLQKPERLKDAAVISNKIPQANEARLF